MRALICLYFFLPVFYVNFLLSLLNKIFQHCCFLILILICFVYRYHCFAGREASRAMAKMSFEESELSNMRIDDLGPFERSTLDDWYQKFKFYKNYPIVGKVSVPPSGLKITIEELSQHKGKKIAEEDKKKSEAVVEVNGIKYQGVTVGPYGDVVVPTGETRIDEPIYLGTREGI